MTLSSIWPVRTIFPGQEVMHRGNQQAFFPFCKCHRRYIAHLNKMLDLKADYNLTKKKKNPTGIQQKAAQCLSE